MDRVSQILSVLSSVTHELHLAERDVRISMPLVAARLRASRDLVAEVKLELEHQLNLETIPRRKG